MFSLKAHHPEKATQSFAFFVFCQWLYIPKGRANLFEEPHQFAFVLKDPTTQAPRIRSQPRSTRPKHTPSQPHSHCCTSQSGAFKYTGDNETQVKPVRAIKVQTGRGAGQDRKEKPDTRTKRVRQIPLKAFIQIKSVKETENHGALKDFILFCPQCLNELLSTKPITQPPTPPHPSFPTLLVFTPDLCSQTSFLSIICQSCYVLVWPCSRRRSPALLLCCFVCRDVLGNSISPPRLTRELGEHKERGAVELVLLPPLLSFLVYTYL